MLANPEVHQYAGLILTAPRTLCSAHCYQTNIKGIVVCLLREHDLPVLQGTFRDNFDELDTDLRNQMSFLHLRSGLDSKAQFMAVHTELCRLDRVTKQLKLQAMAGANNWYSLLDIYEKVTRSTKLEQSSTSLNAYQSMPQLHITKIVQRRFQC